MSICCQWQGERLVLPNSTPFNGKESNCCQCPSQLLKLMACFSVPYSHCLQSFKHSRFFQVWWFGPSFSELCLFHMLSSLGSIPWILNATPYNGMNCILTSPYLVIFFYMFSMTYWKYLNFLFAGAGGGKPQLAVLRTYSWFCTQESNVTGFWGPYVGLGIKLGSGTLQALSLSGPNLSCLQWAKLMRTFASLTVENTDNFLFTWSCFIVTWQSHYVLKPGFLMWQILF